MWVFLLTVHDCIKVVRVSCECFYWLFRIVLRWWEFHVIVVIDCSGLYSGGESFMWVFLLTVHDCIKVVTVSCEFLYWLFRIVLRWWEFHVSVFIDCSGLYYGGESFIWVLVLTILDCIKVVRVSCEYFYWLFMIVLRWWQFHVSVFINCSWLS